MKRALHASTRLLLFALAGTALAQDRTGGFRESDVVGGAKWFMHVNLTELKASKVGEQLISKIDGDAKRKIRAFERMISFNPLEDLDSVTLSGTAAEPEKAVALIRGVFDVPHLTDLALAADDHDTHAHGGRTIHSWTDKKKPGERVYASLLSDHHMLFGPDLSLIKSAVDTLQAKAEGPAPKPRFPAIDPRVPFVTAWADLSVLDSLAIESAFVRKIRTLHLSVGETEGKAFARALIDASDQRTPRLLGKMLAGVLAFGEAADQIPASTADAVAIDASGTSLVVDGAMDLDSLLEMLQGLEGLKDQL
jgi:hypothetical protein